MLAILHRDWSSRRSAGSRPPVIGRRQTLPYMAKEISQSARVHVGNQNSASARRLWGQFKRKLYSRPCHLSPLLHASVAPNKVPVFTRRSAVTQMSRPSQPKVTSSDPNGVSVIQSQSRASAAPALPQQVPQLVPAQPSSPGGKAAAPGKMKKAPADKDSDEYRQRRERNNLAVKKSRQRSKQKAMDTQQRVNQLKEENERLEAKIKLLSKELSVLKDLFLEHAHNLADNVQPPSGNPDASPAPNNQ